MYNIIDDDHDINDDTNEGKDNTENVEIDQNNERHNVKSERKAIIFHITEESYNYEQYTIYAL